MNCPGATRHVAEKILKPVFLNEGIAFQIQKVSAAEGSGRRVKPKPGSMGMSSKDLTPLLRASTWMRACSRKSN